MVSLDAWHLIIFRALGGQNARKCFCKNGTYVNLGLLKKVKKPFKTVKKLQKGAQNRSKPREKRLAHLNI